MALENAPVSIRAFTGKLKFKGIEKRDVRGFDERTLIEEKVKGVKGGGEK